MKTIEEKVSKIMESASDKKARDIVRLDMRELTMATDYFVICSANTSLQVKAIADNIEKVLAEQGVTFAHKEGYREADWILLDYGDCVVHVFTEEMRQYYNLERLWGEAPTERFVEREA